MPRKPRSLTDGGYYHIITRGNDRKMIFKDSEDYFRFLEILKRYLKKFQILIFNYCLMPNHIHMLLQAIKGAELPKFMQGVLQVYAHCFRKKYDSVGFVFQNRYKSLYVDKERYLIDCARYIERNPLRAKIVRNLIEYPWSSFSYYMKGKDNGVIKRDNPFYMSLASTEDERQRRFIELVLEERLYEKIIDDFFRI